MMTSPATSHHLLKENKEKKLVFDPEALGRLRRELIWTLGEARAQGVLARLGLSCGQADALHASSSPVLIRGLGEMVYEGGEAADDNHVVEVTDSCEAAQHKKFYPVPAKQAQCWLLSGYLTGLWSGRMGTPVFFLETQCAAKGDPHCRFVGKLREAWGPEEEASLVRFDEDDMALELFSTRDELQLTRDRFQNLFEQSSTPILIVDPENGRYLNANLAAEDMTGYSRDELLKMSVFDLRHPQEHQKAVAQLKTILADGRVDDEEGTIVRKDGTHRMIARSGKLLDYGGQRVIQITMRDITDLKVSEQKEKDLQHQLLRSERLSSIGRLAAGVAHEIKNPLGAIRNAIYYVKNALLNNAVLETDPHISEILKLAESEVDSAVTIIDELLDFSRVVQLVPRRTRLNELLENIPNIARIPESVKLNWDLDPTLPSAIVDPDRLNQVFCNIVNNAVQAMPQGGTLTIKSQILAESADAGTERVLISFQDTGAGIEPIHLSKIFEPLFTTKARGTGLGLAISSNIMEKHGGAILVTSQVGKGSTFTVKLALQPPPEKEEKIL